MSEFGKYLERPITAININESSWGHLINFIKYSYNYI